MPIALVTGPGSGIGRATALELAIEGYHVVAAGRSPERIELVIGAIERSGGTAEFLGLDLSSLASVRSAVARFLDSGRNLDVLVNNAGIGINRRGLTDDGFEVHFGINHLGHHLLTTGLSAAFHPGTRVVSLASAVHFRARGIDFDAVRRPIRGIGYDAYAVSKLANVLFIRELGRRHPEWDSYAVHPGLVDTPLIPRWVRLFTRSSMLTPEQGADTVVWCATSDEASGQTGHYYQRRRVTTPSLPAQDDQLALQLWERSEQWCLQP
jgi:NAD(P)-dependent dehydrogenase (short-subunit alcohol dehydrogenase family)